MTNDLMNDNNYHREYGDDLKPKDPRLCLGWRWLKRASGMDEEQLKKWTHFQCSYARSGNWVLEAVQWGSEEDVEYEARVEYHDEKILEKEGYKTRLDAQIGAEKMLYGFLRDEFKRVMDKFNRNKNIASLRGWSIYWDGRTWRFYSNDKTLEESETPPCKKCGKTFEGSFSGYEDPCLGLLPGVNNACCGHGDPEQAYIRFTNGMVVEGFDRVITPEDIENKSKNWGKNGG